MATTPDLKKHCIDELRRRSQNISWVIKTRNSPRSAYVLDFQLLCQPHTVNIHRDVYKRLDLATAFKGLMIVTFTDEKSQVQPSTSKQEELRPFYYPSPSPSPTTTDENAEISELVDIPLPEEVEQDKVTIEDSDWSPPPIAYRTINCKCRYNSQFPDIDEEECSRCGQIKRKSWPGPDCQDEQ